MSLDADGREPGTGVGGLSARQDGPDQSQGSAPLPEEIRAAARLEDGDLFDAEITAEGILLRPQKVIDATQAWFWTPAWQAGEREADADQDGGRVETFDSGASFATALRSIAKPGVKRPRAR